MATVKVRILLAGFTPSMRFPGGQLRCDSNHNTQMGQGASFLDFPARTGSQQMPLSSLFQSPGNVCSFDAAILSITSLDWRKAPSWLAKVMWVTCQGRSD